MTRGVLLFAHNNTEIDYLKMSCANALMIKKNLNVPVTLITDTGTLSWGNKLFEPTMLKYCFENIIEVKRNYKFDNLRNFNDTTYSAKSLQFYNCNHWEVYNLSPYDETLVVDVDYLIMSSVLSRCWNSNYDILINYKILSTIDEKTYTKYIDNFGIKLYWATAFYFKKSKFSEMFFMLIKHIQNNYQYYRELYLLSSGMFRNDNAFSIAIHILNGFIDDTDSLISTLPIPELMMSWDTDDIYQIPDINEIILYSEKKKEQGTYLLTHLKNQDIHVMNKWAINRFSDKIIKLYTGQ